MRRVVGNSLLFKMLENLLNHHRIFHTGNDLDRALTLLTDFNFNIEYPFQSLSPIHSSMTFCRCLLIPGLLLQLLSTLASLGWGNMNSILAIGSEHTVEPGEVDSGLGH